MKADFSSDERVCFCGPLVRADGAHLARIAQARAKERFEREKIEHEARLAARDAKAKGSGLDNVRGD